MKLRRVAAAYSAAMATVLLVSAVDEAVKGDLLVIEAGRIGWGTVALLVAWFVASIYVALPYLR